MKIHEKVMAMDPPRYTVSMAARLVGRDQDTLKRWKREGIFVPSDTAEFGKLVVDLYTPDDILAMKKITRALRPGRKTA